MTLTLIQRNPDASAAPRQAEFRAPGGTLGRDPANHLVLPDESGKLCRVQAALRVDPYACRLRNLSSMSFVSVNDVPLAAGQELSIAPGDTLRIGAYVLGVEVTQPAVAAAAGPSTAPTLGPVAAAGFVAAPPAAPTSVAAAAVSPTPVSPAVVSTAGVSTAAVSMAAPAAAPRAPEPLYAPEPIPEPPRAPAAAPQPAAVASESAARAPVDRDPVDRDPVDRDPIPPAPSAAPHPMAPPDFPDLSDFDALGKPPAGDRDPLLSAAPAPLAPEPEPQQPPEDVFSGLFGPGTLPVGTVSDVSAHPFEMESAQKRNAADPLSHLPRGDASVSRPQRDPLAMFDAPHGGHDVFADQTPSTLPAHDPLTSMRSDPVRDTLQRPRESDGRMSTRDNAPMSGSFLRPAAPRAPARTGNERGTDRSHGDRSHGDRVHGDRVHGDRTRGGHDNDH
ncbi:FHA domain-containing protein [Bordetella genomosp. 13]|uniref:FHA domain-containing protein n=1 Tax=Bordetella genomosp. 13 TaxID=463040 RepID=UPI0011A2502F|nr:FHA domain-containing protein [Bordetella genomosp. 13]